MVQAAQFADTTYSYISFWVIDIHRFVPQVLMQEVSAKEIQIIKNNVSENRINFKTFIILSI